MEHPSNAVLLMIRRGLEVDPALLAHVEGCDTCQHELAHCMDGGTARLAAMDVDAVVDGLLAEVEAPVRPRWLRWAVSFGAAAVALVVTAVLVWGPSGSGLRSKGGVSIKHKVVRDGQVLQPSSTFLYRAGDELLVDLLADVDGSITFAYLEAEDISPIAGVVDVPITAGAVLHVDGTFTLECRDALETLLVFYREGTGPVVLDLDEPHLSLTFPCAEGSQ